MRVRLEDKHHLRKSADRKAQIRKAFVLLARLICAFQSADFLRWCLSSKRTFTHNLFFLFPIVFGIICISFIRGDKKMNKIEAWAPGMCTGVYKWANTKYWTVCEVHVQHWHKNYFKGSVDRSRHERHFCSLLPYFLLSWLQIFQLCLSELHPLIWFFFKNSFRKKKNIQKTTQNALAPSIFILLSIVLKLGTPLLHTQAQNTLLQNF